MIRVLKCKVTPNLEQRTAILATMTSFAEASTQITAIALEAKEFNKFRLYGISYKAIRQISNLPSMCVCLAIQRVSEMKRTASRAKFHPNYLPLHKNTVRYNPHAETIGLTTTQGRVKDVPLLLGTYQRNLIGEVNRTSGKLTYDKRKDEFYIIFYIKTEDPEPSGTNVLGVDRGINRIVTASDGFIKSGKSLNFLRKRIQNTRSSLQSKGTKGTKRVLKRLSGKMARLQKNTNHVLSKQIVERARQTDSFIALENLKGIRERCRDKGKKLRKLLGGWAFYQLETFILYKAALAGVKVVFVDPRNTSKRCANCLEIGTRKKHKFSCSQCGNIADADFNASLNIARLGLQVSQAEAACS